MKKAGRYPKAFKIEAIRLLNSGDKPASELAMELGIKRTLLYRWRDQFETKGEAAFSGSGRPRNDQLSELSKLKKELKEVTEERDILKKSRSVLCKGPQVKYAFIRKNSIQHGVQKMCRVLKASTSGYYTWKTRLISKRELFDKYLTTQIQMVHVESKANYGAIKTWKALKIKGISCGKHQVARFRRINGIESKRRKRFKVTTLSRNTAWIAPNKLNRCF